MTPSLPRVTEIEGLTIDTVARTAFSRSAVRARLSNGLVLLFLEDHSAPVVSVQVWMRVGSAHEEPGKTGLAHLLEHLMFKGTPTYPKGVFDRLLERAGAQCNAATSFDYTTYYETLPATHLDLALRLEADRLAHLSLDSTSFEAEREVVRSERAFRIDDDPDGRLEEHLNGLMFPDHPYGRPVLGIPEELDQITLQDCIAFHQKWYTPSRMVLVVVGDLCWPETAQAVVRHFGPLPRSPEGDLPNVSLHSAPTPGARHAVLRLPLRAERLRIGWRTVPITHDAVFPLEFLQVILFSGDASRVPMRLVEEEGLASQVEGISDSMALDGAFYVDVALNRHVRSKEAWQVIREELQRLSRKGPRPSEMRRAQNQLEVTFLRSMVSAESRAMQLGTFEVTAGDFRRVFRFQERLRKVTAEEVRQAASRWLDPDRAVLVTGRPR